MDAYYKDEVGFGLETYDKDGSLIAKRAATYDGYGILNIGWYPEDVIELLNLTEGETGIIRWSCEESEKGVKGMTFKITSAIQNAGLKSK